MEAYYSIELTKLMILKEMRIMEAIFILCFVFMFISPFLNSLSLPSLLLLLSKCVKKLFYYLLIFLGKTKKSKRRWINTSETLSSKESMQKEISKTV